MKITRKQLFASILSNLGVNTGESPIRETKHYISSGIYRYYKSSDKLIKKASDMVFAGDRYEKMIKKTNYQIIKTLGGLRMVNEKTKEVIINFSHKDEPLVLI